MMHRFLLILLLVGSSYTQQPDGIEISVVKGHKRITYVAENVTDQSLHLFFKVDSKGFRRRADRPFIKQIPAKTKINLLTLIPLKNADTVHTYVAIVTKPEHDIGIRKTDTLDREIRRVRPDTVGQ
jgi:hypothetical protein